MKTFRHSTQEPWQPAAHHHRTSPKAHESQPLEETPSLHQTIRTSGKIAAQGKWSEVMNGAAIQRQSGVEEEELLQGQFAAQRARMEDEELAQGKFSKAPPSRQLSDPGAWGLSAPVQRKGNHTGIPDDLKTHLETTFNTDFSSVRVHPDSSKAPAVGALAYTQGHDIHFAPGQFSPNTSSGRRLLGHELTHVVQQREGRVRPTTEVGGMPVNDEGSLEREADEFGDRV